MNGSGLLGLFSTSIKYVFVLSFDYKHTTNSTQQYKVVVEAQDSHLVDSDALVDTEVLTAQSVDGDVPAERAHTVLLQRQAIAPTPQHTRPLRALSLLRLAVHLH